MSFNVSSYFIILPLKDLEYLSAPLLLPNVRQFKASVYHSFFFDLSIKMTLNLEVRSYLHMPDIYTMIGSAKDEQNRY